jgi:hypothetical protein
MGVMHILICLFLVVGEVGEMVHMDNVMPENQHDDQRYSASQGSICAWPLICTCYFFFYTGANYKPNMTLPASLRKEYN